MSNYSFDDLIFYRTLMQIECSHNIMKHDRLFNKGKTNTIWIHKFFSYIEKISKLGW